MSDLRIAQLESLLDSARWYVKEFLPRTADEEFDQTALLGEIDLVLPGSVEFSPTCDHEFCCLPKGHEGAHDEIPL